MTLVRVVAWIYLAVAALAVVAGAGEETFGLVAMGFAAAVAGVVFLAIDRIIVLLTEIRDRLPPQATAPEPEPPLPDTKMTPDELQRKIDAARQAQATAAGQAARGS
jgi:hypothetical protein